jgi:hypothetical protein
MLYVIYCRDRADGAPIRQANRPAHLAWAKDQPEIRMAGPMLADDGETMIGSLFVREAPDLETVRRIHGEDPYVRAGLFERMEIHPFRWLLPAGS